MSEQFFIMVLFFFFDFFLMVVYVNSTDSQDQMSTAAASIAAMAGLPGVSADCRSFATLYNCGNIFTRCEQIPQTTGNLLIIFYSNPSFCVNSAVSLLM